MMKNVCLLIDAIESSFTPDLPYYGLEVAVIFSHFAEKELISDILPFILTWFILVLVPTVCFPVFSPILARFSSFKPSTVTGIPPITFQNPNQRTAFFSMVAVAYYKLDPIVSVAILLFSIILPFINKKNSLIQLIISSVMGIATYEISEFYNSFEEIILIFTAVVLVLGLFVKDPFGKKDSIVEFQAEIMDSFGKLIFETIIHFYSIESGKVVAFALAIQFMFTFISKTLLEKMTPINKITFI